MRELFIYYRVRPANAAAALATVQRVHARLHTRYPGLSARLLRRPADTNELQTWMETYAIATGIDDAMQTDIETEAHALLTMIEGARHAEVFVACAW